MSDDMRAEMQHWQARCDEMQVAIERVREDRDTLKNKVVLLDGLNDMYIQEIKQLKSMLERIKIAMSEGQEL